MRFRRYWRIEAFQDTPRKRAVLARKQRLERERLPLFTDQVAEEQPSVDEVMCQRAQDFARWQQQQRNARAMTWRRARRQLSEYGHNLRPLLRDAWNTAPYPADPIYLLMFLDSIESGRIDIEALPWRVN